VLDPPLGNSAHAGGDAANLWQCHIDAKLHGCCQAVSDKHMSP
jgi:hypothetical protein